MKDTDVNGSLHYLDFMCVWEGRGGGGGGGGQKHLYPPYLPNRGNTVSYLWESFYLVVGVQSRVLKLNKLDHLFNFFEVLNLVFACIYNEKD